MDTNICNSRCSCAVVGEGVANAKSKIAALHDRVKAASTVGAVQAQMQAQVAAHIQELKACPSCSHYCGSIGW